MTWNLLNDFNNCPDVSTAWLYGFLFFIAGALFVTLAYVIIKAGEPKIKKVESEVNDRKFS